MSDLATPTPRMNTAMNHIAHALRAYRVNPSAREALIAVLADCLRAILGEYEREFMFDVCLEIAAGAPPLDGKNERHQ